MATVIREPDTFGSAFNQGMSVFNAMRNMKNNKKRAEAAADRAVAAGIRDEERLRLSKEKASRDVTDWQKKQKTFVQDFESKNNALRLQDQQIEKNKRAALKQQRDQTLAGFESMVQAGSRNLESAAKTRKRIGASQEGDRKLSKEQLLDLKEADLLTSQGNALIARGTNLKLGFLNPQAFTPEDIAKMIDTSIKSSELQSLRTPVIAFSGAQEAEASGMQKFIRKESMKSFVDARSRGDMTTMRSIYADPKQAFNPAALQISSDAVKLVTDPLFRADLSKTPEGKTALKTIMAGALADVTGTDFGVSLLNPWGFGKDVPTITPIASPSATPKEGAGFKVGSSTSFGAGAAAGAATTGLTEALKANQPGGTPLQNQSLPTRIKPRRSNEDLLKRAFELTGAN